jgi:hypothetical protein
MATFTFQKPTQNTFDLHLSATAHASYAITTNISVDGYTHEPTVVTSTTNSIGGQFINTRWQIGHVSPNPTITVTATDSTGATVDIVVGEQQFPDDDHGLSYVVVSGNDSGSDNDYDDIVLLFYASK